jgi:alkylation response protein AidB-like acyl-CoA dehydrogenase
MSEPELGSDVAAIRTRAKNNGDGTYTIDGPEDVADQRRQLDAGLPLWCAPMKARTSRTAT